MKYTPEEVLQILDAYRQNILSVDNTSTEHLKDWWGKKQLRTKVEIIESEAGWGQKVDEVQYFDTPELAEKFVEKYNANNKLITTPNWYMYARIAE